MRKGWFKIPGVQDGDRTLAQQLTGLSRLLDGVKGKDVLDLGSAEGLISRECMARGAHSVRGVEVVQASVDIANQMRDGMTKLTFECADLNTAYAPSMTFDIVLMLGVLHKLKEPCLVAERFGASARQLCVIRLPPKHAPMIVDARSGGQPHDVNKALNRAGLKLDGVESGHFDEWVGYYRRA